MTVVDPIRSLKPNVRLTLSYIFPSLSLIFLLLSSLSGPGAKFFFLTIHSDPNHTLQIGGLGLCSAGWGVSEQQGPTDNRIAGEKSAGGTEKNTNCSGTAKFGYDVGSDVLGHNVQGVPHLLAFHFALFWILLPLAVVHPVVTIKINYLLARTSRLAHLLWGIPAIFLVMFITVAAAGFGMVSAIAGHADISKVTKEGCFWLIIPALIFLGIWLCFNIHLYRYSSAFHRTAKLAPKMARQRAIEAVEAQEEEQQGTPSAPPRFGWFKEQKKEEKEEHAMETEVGGGTATGQGTLLGFGGWWNSGHEKLASFS